MTLVGILLLSGLVLVAVEGVGYSRGGYGSEFWSSPLDDKLDHIAGHRREWWWISLWSLVGLLTMGGGTFGLAALIAEDGEPVLAFVALGVWVVAMVGWVGGLTVQAAGMPQAASQRADSGSTPDWIHPLWWFVYVTEGTWIIGANMAYAVFGLGILLSSSMPVWVGWTSIAGGLLISLGVIVTRDGFPQLAVVVPAVIGVALLLRAL